MKLYIKYIIISCLLLFTFSTFGQGLQLATMTDMGQINLTNPAETVDKRFYIGVSPFIGVGTSIGGAQIYQVNNQFLPGFIELDKLDDENFLALNVSSPFSFGFKVKKWMFNVHSTPVFNTQIGFNKDFLGFAGQGNAAYTGQTLNLDPKFDITLYQEFGVGVSRKFLEIFSAGIRAKYLIGGFNVTTNDGNLALTTNEAFYQLDASAQYQINISGAPEMSSIQDFGMIDSILQSQIFNPFGSLTQSQGFAFDIGATMDIGKLLHVGISILDIGFINWEENSYQYDIAGDFTFEGIDATDFLTGDEISDISDTLNDIVSLSSNPTTYQAGVNAKIYTTARLKFGKDFYLSGVLRNEFTPSGVHTGFGIGVQKYFGDILGLGAMYSIQNGSFANVGANLSLKLGPIQVFAVSDNLLPLINQWQAANTNVRIGANVALNNKKKE